MASLGISLIRKPASKSQFVFNLLAIVSKIRLMKLHFITFCLFTFVLQNIVISYAWVPVVIL